ncbi:hypothetical protein EV368DRAFT_88377 [Lentinula lateritia]|nr:hypothetical protein EV368DRAFT_88377 [Lentinula lateritia]
MELAMDVLNALHTTSTSSTHNLANSLRRSADLNDQLRQIGSLFDTTQELFLRSILDLQNAGEDPIVVLEALKAAEPNRIHSKESMACIDDKGHLVESSPPPHLAAEALEGLNKVKKGSADEDSSS